MKSLVLWVCVLGVYALKVDAVNHAKQDGGNALLQLVRNIAHQRGRASDVQKDQVETFENAILKEFDTAMSKAFVADVLAKRNKALAQIHKEGMSQETIEKLRKVEEQIELETRIARTTQRHNAIIQAMQKKAKADEEKGLQHILDAEHEKQRGEALELMRAQKTAAAVDENLARLAAKSESIAATRNSLLALENSRTEAMDKIVSLLQMLTFEQQDASISAAQKESVKQYLFQKLDTFLLQAVSQETLEEIENSIDMSSLSNKQVADLGTVVEDAIFSKLDTKHKIFHQAYLAVLGLKNIDHDEISQQTSRIIAHAIETAVSKRELIEKTIQQLKVFGEQKEKKAAEESKSKQTATAGQTALSSLLFMSQKASSEILKNKDYLHRINKATGGAFYRLSAEARTSFVDDLVQFEFIKGASSHEDTVLGEKVSDSEFAFGCGISSDEPSSSMETCNDINNHFSDPACTSLCIVGFTWFSGMQSLEDRCGHFNASDVESTRRFCCPSIRNCDGTGSCGGICQGKNFRELALKFFKLHHYQDGEGTGDAFRQEVLDKLSSSGFLEDVVESVEKSFRDDASASNSAIFAKLKALKQTDSETEETVPIEGIEDEYEGSGGAAAAAISYVLLSVACTASVFFLV